MNKKKKKKNEDFSLSSLNNFLQLLNISFPSFFSLLTGEMLMMLFTLIARTFLSIKIASVNGQLVQSIITRNLKSFVLIIIKMCVIAIPASFLNSFIQYLKKSISFNVRENLTSYYQNRYIADLRFYQMVNIDSRIKNPDQRITKDIEKFADCFSNLYSNIAKPSLDIILFTRSLAQKVGYGTVSFAFLWYGFSGLVLKFISPPMGMMTAML